MENHRMLGTEEAVVFGAEGGLAETQANRAPYDFATRRHAWYASSQGQVSRCSS
jgi:hypothetical protein